LESFAIRLLEFYSLREGVATYKAYLPRTGDFAFKAVQKSSTIDNKVEADKLSIESSQCLMMMIAEQIWLDWQWHKASKA
jgi:hypothetical protein